jgi:hypothetical protein
MTDIESVAQSQRAFWNSEATRRWVTEQARIDRLMIEVTRAALAYAAPRSSACIAARRGTAC